MVGGGGRTGKAAFLGRACSAARVGVRLSRERHFSSGVKFSGSGGEPRRAQDHRCACVHLLQMGGWWTDRNHTKTHFQGPAWSPRMPGNADPRWRQNGSAALVSETERDRCGRKRTHTDTHSSHHHLHSRFLKSSHISVTIATLLCLPLFFIPAFFPSPLKKKNPSLPLLFSLSSKYNRDPEARSSSFGAAWRRGPWCRTHF